MLKAYTYAQNNNKKNESFFELIIMDYKFLIDLPITRNNVIFTIHNMQEILWLF